MSAVNEFDWLAVTVFWANACGMNAVATEAVAITESAAISAAIVVFRDNIVRVDQGIIYLRFGAE
jgi:hypothetical protein